MVNAPVVRDHGERQGECKERGSVLDDDLAQAHVRTGFDFGQGQDQQRDRDRHDAVAEGQDSVNTCFSFTRHLLARSSLAGERPPEWRHRTRPTRPLNVSTQACPCGVSCYGLRFGKNRQRVNITPIAVAMSRIRLLGCGWSRRPGQAASGARFRRNSWPAGRTRG